MGKNGGGGSGARVQKRNEKRGGSEGSGQRALNETYNVEGDNEQWCWWQAMPKSQ